MSTCKTINSKEYFDRIRTHNVVFWGCGSKARQTLEICKKMGIIPVAAVDSNSSLWGTEFFDGIMIESWDDVKKKYNNLFILITATVTNAIDIIDSNDFETENVQFSHMSNPFKTENSLLDISADNELQICNSYDFFKDDISKEIFVECINYKKTGNMLPLLSYMDGDTDRGFFGLFFDQILSDTYNVGLIDVGAFTGDTMTDFAMWSRGNYMRIDCFEADEGNFGGLKECVRLSRLSRVNIYNDALWSGCEEKEFFTYSEGNSINYDSSNLFRSIEFTADANTKELARKKNLNPIKRNIKTKTLDSYDFQKTYQGMHTVLKINALGSDLNILKGGAKLIRNIKPILVMEFGVDTRSTLELISEIRQIRDDYSLYLRVIRVFGDIKVVLYAR